MCGPGPRFVGPGCFFFAKSTICFELVLSFQKLDTIYDRILWTMKLLKETCIGSLIYNKRTKKWAKFVDFWPMKS